MILNLEESNSRQMRSHRQTIIESAFRESSQHHYRMPRQVTISSEMSREEIPELYNLHEQNLIHTLSRIVPIQQLVRINSMNKKHGFLQYTTQKGTVSQLDFQFIKESGRKRGKSKIQCTMSRVLMREEKTAKKNEEVWPCCEKREDLRKHQTREMLEPCPKKSKRGMFLNMKRQREVSLFQQ